MVSRKRHLAKTITWRLLATSITVLLTWFVTNDISAATGVGLLDIVVKMALYYMHERVWYRNKFGVE
tara:strand:- start:101 stop:301 length:201 start_codon:yes stop_codon:yes gene_type:complete